MSVAAIHRYERNNDAATAAAFDVIHAETKQLQKMSLSDPQEQNKEKVLVGSGSNQFQTCSLGAYSCVDNDFERLFCSEAAKESMKREREWHALHTCTKCGFCEHSCRCNVRAPRWGRCNGRSEFLEMSAKNKKKIDAVDAIPPSRAKRNQKVLEEAKDLDLSLFWAAIQKK